MCDWFFLDIFCLSDKWHLMKVYTSTISNNNNYKRLVKIKDNSHVIESFLQPPSLSIWEWNGRK